ncbi:hypothetical protein V5F40_21805 [Xanthobacter sp. DSM 14520]|uniref:hypothetical protein n=1 Tax=Xanthobacter autotrophicus (strain ATCC BAA-1158 / Py2) TaxID=78245 RepID=UPI00372A973D
MSLPPSGEAGRDPRRGAYLPGLTPEVRRRLELTIEALSAQEGARDCNLYVLRDMELREHILTDFITKTCGITSPRFDASEETRTQFIVLIEEEA